MRTTRLLSAVRLPWLRPFLGLAFATSATLGTSMAYGFDADSDSIVDQADAFPCNAQSAAVIFSPSQGKHGMLLIEDQWPSQGDLDFNDAVLAYNYVAELNSAGQVLSLRANYNLLAVGGVFNNGLGLHLPVPTSAVGSVRLTVGQGASTALTPETDPELNVRVLANMRQLFDNRAGTINSDPGQPPVTGLPLEVEVRFSTPVSLDLGQAPFDVYIFRSERTGHEIHAPQYSGTLAMDRSLFQTQDDGSTTSRHYVDRDGLPFVLNLPGLNPWAREGVSIEHLYPNIVTFAASGGAQARDFYTQGVDLSYAYGWSVPSDLSPAEWPAWSSPVTPQFIGSPSIPADTGCINAWGLSVEFGTSRDTYGYAVAPDPSGNLVITGYTTASFQGASNAGGKDIFVAKVDRAGTLLWARQFGGSGNEAGRAITIDSSGAIYVAGETGSALGGQTLAGQSDAFVMRLDSNGALQWTRLLGGTGTDMARGLVLAPNGDLYVGGGSTSRDLPGANYPGNSPYSFLARYSTAGNRVWVQANRTDPSDPSDYNYTSALAVDGAGNIYAAGSEHRYSQNNSAAANQFLLKYDGATGASLWVRHIGEYGYNLGSSDYRFANAFGVTTSPAGEVYVTGTWEAGSAASSWNGWERTPGDRSADITLAKFDANGTQLWARSIGSTDAQPDYALAVLTDAQGNVYPMGYTGGALPGQTAGGNFDYFVGRFDAQGNRQWLVQHNTSNDDGAFGGAIDNAGGAIYVVGNTGQITGNPISLGNQYYGFVSKHNLGTGARDAFQTTARVPPDRTSCAAIINGGQSTGSGVYTIDPDGTGPNGAFDVYCDMNRHGGGWILIGKYGEGAQANNAFDLDQNTSALTSGTPPTSAQYSHFNLARFDAFGSVWTIRSDTDAYNNQSHFQYVFFRPKAGLTVLPSQVSHNWRGTSTYQLLSQMIASSTTGLNNSTWVDLPPCDGGHCGASIVMFTHRYGSGSQCIDTSGQTSSCHAPPGSIATEWVGANTAAFGVQDGVGHTWGRKGMYWIKAVR